MIDPKKAKPGDVFWLHEAGIVRKIEVAEKSGTFHSGGPDRVPIKNGIAYKTVSASDLHVRREMAVSIALTWLYGIQKEFSDKIKNLLIVMRHNEEVKEEEERQDKVRSDESIGDISCV